MNHLSFLKNLFLAFILVLILTVVFIQIGIKHGRDLERSEIEAETEVLRESINSLEATIVRLKKDALIADIVACESSGRHKGLWGDGGKSYGIAQFQKNTFYYLAKKAGVSGLKWKSREDQLWLLRWSIDNGYGDNWTCYQKLAD